jgi:predicted Zn-dependent protease
MIWALLLVAVAGVAVLLVWILGPPPPLVWHETVAISQARLASDAQLPELIAQFPNSPGVLVEWTERAVREKDWSEVVRRAERFRHKFPGDIYGYLAGARGLLRTEDWDAAEALLQTAVRKFPKKPGPQIQYAFIANERRNWSEARRRWQKVQQHFPDEAAGFTWDGVALLEMKQFDEADTMLATVCDRFPDNEDGLLWYARTAHRRGAWAEAARRWELLRSRFEAHPEGYLHGSEALRQAGRIDEAADVISKGIFIFPNNQAMQEKRASIGIPSPTKHSSDPLPSGSS